MEELIPITARSFHKKSVLPVDGAENLGILSGLIIADDKSSGSSAILSVCQYGIKLVTSNELLWSQTKGKTGAVNFYLEDKKVVIQNKRPNERTIDMVFIYPSMV